MAARYAGFEQDKPPEQLTNKYTVNLLKCTPFYEDLCGFRPLDRSFQNRKNLVTDINGLKLYIAAPFSPSSYGCTTPKWGSIQRIRPSIEAEGLLYFCSENLMAGGGMFRS